MAVKEKDLPQVVSLGSSDYIRAVSSTGTSEILQYSFLEAIMHNGMITLDTTAAAGTTDGDLYRAIDALGWTSDVIE